MGYFIGGLIVLGVLIFLARLIVSTDPRALVGIIRYAVGFGLIGIGAIMILASRWMLGGAAVAAGISVIANGRIGPIDLGGRSRTIGTGSTVRSRFLRMQLDHDSGALTGEILKGTFAGQTLDELDQAALLAFRDEVSSDGESLALVEAYLDRRMPGWRENVEGDAATGTGGTPDTSPMTDEQAYEILGLSPRASQTEIRAAHRRLMKKVHPDQGGSTFLATKINEAKDRLLGNHR